MVVVSLCGGSEVVWCRRVCNEPVRLCGEEVVMNP